MESHGRPRRVIESHGGSWRGVENCGGLQRGTESHRGPEKATEGHEEPWRITEGHRGPRRAAENSLWLQAGGKIDHIYSCWTARLEGFTRSIFNSLFKSDGEKCTADVEQVILKRSVTKAASVLAVTLRTARSLTFHGEGQSFIHSANIP